MAIKEMMGRPIENLPGEGVRAEGSSGQIPSDAFFRMGIVPAARKYLEMVKRKQTIPEIARALEAGGFKHRSKRFDATIRTTLRRSGEFMKLGRGEWALPEWYRGGKRTQGKTAENGADQDE
jgi:hypothetical protein